MSHGKRTLDVLDPPAWGEPEFQSHLVTTCHRLRTKPIGEFSTEDLRIMIGQQIGLEHLVPLALAKVEGNPLCEGDFFPGDLLLALLRAETTFWAEYPSHKVTLERIVGGLADVTEELQSAVAAFRNSG